MFLWKTIKIIGYLLFLITLFIVIGTIYTEFNNPNIIAENESIVFNISSLVGYAIGLLLFFIPSTWLIKFSNKKINAIKDNNVLYTK